MGNHVTFAFSSSYALISQHAEAAISPCRNFRTNTPALAQPASSTAPPVSPPLRLHLRLVGLPPRSFVWSTMEKVAGILTPNPEL